MIRRWYDASNDWLEERPRIVNTFLEVWWFAVGWVCCLVVYGKLFA